MSVSLGHHWCLPNSHPPPSWLAKPWFVPTTLCPAPGNECDWSSQSWHTHSSQPGIGPRWACDLVLTNRTHQGSPPHGRSREMVSTKQDCQCRPCPSLPALDTAGGEGFFGPSCHLVPVTWHKAGVLRMTKGRDRGLQSWPHQTSFKINDRSPYGWSQC